MEEFLRLCCAGRINVESLITHRYPLDEAPAAYQTVLDPTSGSLAVLLRYKTADQPGPTPHQPKHKVELSAAPLGSDAVGVALIGAGNLARWAHLPALTKISGVKLEAIHSASGARGKGYAQRFKARYCATDYQEVLNDPNIQLVVIASRNQHHAQQALAALRAGKHVFVEKPMCLTEQECIDLTQAVRETGKQLTVGFNRRFAPYYAKLKASVSKRSGPAVINCRVNSPGISGSYWMADPSVGGAILGEACHFVDLMYWLLQSEPVSVMAYSLPTEKREPIGENNLVALFQFADNSIASLTYCTVGSKTSGGERVEVYAPGLGAVSEDFKALKINTNVSRSHAKIWPDKGYEPQLRSFVEAIRKGAVPNVTVLDGVRSTIGCLKMLESVRLGEPLALDLTAYR
jgi:predicted dehydrogenase